MVGRLGGGVWGLQGGGECIQEATPAAQRLQGTHPLKSLESGDRGQMRVTGELHGNGEGFPAKGRQGEVSRRSSP